ncbi:MAG TPA: hypothetical protein VIK03_00700, partial [Thermoleophilia bacterium]
VSRRALGTLRQGVDLEEGMTSPADVRLKKQSAKTALVEITIHEGRKHQVRRMFVAVGLPVEELSRRRYGPLTDKGLEPGGFRELTGEEVEALRRAGEEVAGEVANEVEGSPLMLAAEVQEEAADAVLTRADVSSETYTEASSDEGESQPFEAGEAHAVPGREPEPGESPDETAGIDDPDEAESGQPDVPAEPSGDPDAPPQDDDA